MNRSCQILHFLCQPVLERSAFKKKMQQLLKTSAAAGGSAVFHNRNTSMFFIIGKTVFSPRIIYETIIQKRDCLQ